MRGASVVDRPIELSTFLSDFTRLGRLLINWNVLKISMRMYIVHVLACNVYEVKYINRWKQLCHLHINSSLYDHMNFLEPSVSSFAL